MRLRQFGFAATAAVTLLATTIVSTSPAAAWCRWGCGWGWRGPGPFVAGALIGGAIVGTAAVASRAAAGPGPGPGPAVCPVGYHLGPAGRRCWPN